MEGTEDVGPPRLTVVPEALEQRIDHLRDLTILRVAQLIIPEQDAGLKGCTYKQKSAIDFQEKAITIEKPLKNVGSRISVSQEEITPAPEKQRE